MDNKNKDELIKAVFYMDMVEGTNIKEELDRLFEIMVQMDSHDFDFDTWLKDNEPVVNFEKWLKENNLD